MNAGPAQGLVNVVHVFARTRRSMLLLLPCQTEWNLPPPYLSERYLAFLKARGTELKPIFGERNVYTCQNRLIYILLMPGADFKFHLQLPNFVQTGVTLVKRILDVFLMASFFIFVFLQKKMFWHERQLDVLSHLSLQNPSLRADVCAFDASQVCFLLQKRLGLSRRFFGLG